jgi:hypothetical protein
MSKTTLKVNRPHRSAFAKLIPTACKVYEENAESLNSTFRLLSDLAFSAAP